MLRTRRETCPSAPAVCSAMATSMSSTYRPVPMIQSSGS